MDGFLLVNKPVDISSAACVAQLKRAFGFSKIGHTGTLDPFAQGLLPIAVGKATRAIEYLPKTRKCYRATLKLGEETDTLDTEGTVIAQMPIPPGLDGTSINATLARLIGKQSQVPPAYSAVKIAGKALYDYARRGQEPSVAPQARDITIHSLSLLNWEPPFLSFDVCCSGGTYVRVLGQSLAHQLGTCGHLIFLERTESDGFSLAHARPLDDILQDRELHVISVPIFKALSHLPQLALKDEQVAIALRQGKPQLIPKSEVPGLTTNDHVVAVTYQDDLVAVMKVTDDPYLKIDKGF